MWANTLAWTSRKGGYMDGEHQPALLPSAGYRAPEIAGQEAYSLSEGSWPSCSAMQERPDQTHTRASRRHQAFISGLLVFVFP